MAKSLQNLPKWAIALIGLLLIGFWTMSVYNGLIASQGKVGESWAQVETNYQRRADLVPQLVATVSGAADFESSTLTAVTEARTNWLNTQSDSNATLNDQIASARQFDNAISRLLVSVESYPTLTATEGFRTLQSQLEGTENRVAVSRQDFNTFVTAYNIKISRFPTLIIARIFGFEKSELFAADTGAEKAPVVNFGE